MKRFVYDVWLSMRLDATRHDIASIVDTFGSAFAVYSASSADLYSAGLSDKLISLLSNKELKPASSAIEYCISNGISIAVRGEEGYPERLAAIPNPPHLLYINGKLPPIDENLAVAIVGTRSMSEYGMRSAYKIAYELASAGVTVVSGMALGIDASAACGVLDAGGATVAVLGCGLNNPYPSSHKRLMSEIAEKGAVITEYSPYTPPRAYQFPQRNRIISGLCQGTLVIEGGEKSGSIITARYAITQGRNIFALPGNIGDQNSLGSNLLISSGARMTLSSADIIKEYDYLWNSSLDREAYEHALKHSEMKPGALIAHGVNEVRPKAAPAPSNAFVAEPTQEEKPKRRVKPLKKPATEAEEEPAPIRPDREQLLASLSESEAAVFKAMPSDGTPITADGISVASGLSIFEITSALTTLEIMGCINILPGGKYHII